jgi:hypothetical protein
MQNYDNCNPVNIDTMSDGRILVVLEGWLDIPPPHTRRSTKRGHKNHKKYTILDTKSISLKSQHKWSPMLKPRLNSGPN